MRFEGSWLSWTAASLLCLPAAGQSVISAHAGVIHFFEGTVLVDGQRVQSKFGEYLQVKEGSELRTENGRAELLLNPDTFLRVGENSCIRMISSNLAAPRVEFVSGAAILEASGSAAPPVKLVYGDYEISFSKTGRYRIDSDPAELRVYSGEADVAAHGDSVIVDEHDRVAFTPQLLTRPFDHEAGDFLDIWSSQRSAAIEASNAEAAKTPDLSSAVNSMQNNNGLGGILVDPPPGAGSYGGLPPDPGAYATNIPGYVPPVNDQWWGVTTPYGIYGGVYGAGGIYGPGLYGSGLYGFAPVGPVGVYPLGIYPGSIYFGGANRGYFPSTVTIPRPLSGITGIRPITPVVRPTTPYTPLRSSPGGSYRAPVSPAPVHSFPSVPRSAAGHAAGRR